ncbi:MAG: AMP-binding protein [Candidatus Thiodiazotropha sp. (ex Rostrolucina anterorostrata)]|nr:AMP-binding protein [Candidatus Thiodiazotropha sp. (ex Rostrolucina anterorostrata)]
MTLHDDILFRLRFSSTEDRPLAYRDGASISVGQFRDDVERLAQELTTEGDLLLTCDGRYGFAVGLLAAWLTEHAVILPPNRLPQTLEGIRANNQLVFECDEGWQQDLKASVSSNSERHGEWRLEFQVDRPAVRLFTSGSTGDPKIIPKTIGNLLAEANTLSRAFNWPDGTVVSTVPPQHQYGLTFSLLLPWTAGLPWADATPLYPEDILALVQATTAGTLISVPIQYKAMLADQIPLHSMTCVSAASPLMFDLAEAWWKLQGKEILEIYGSTETGVIASRHQLTAPEWWPFEDVKVSTERELLTVASPFVSNIYGERFQSADHIQQSVTGGFQLLGRADSIVKVGGKRISLDGITKQILACEGVLDAAVITQSSNGVIRDHVICAALVVENINTFNIKKLRSFLRGRLDGIEVPKRLLFVDKLPRTANGKLPQKNLEQLFEVEEKDIV